MAVVDMRAVDRLIDGPKTPAAAPGTATPVASATSLKGTIVRPVQSGPQNKHFDMQPYLFASDDCKLEGCLTSYCRGEVPSFMDAASLAPWVKAVFGTYENHPTDPKQVVTIGDPDITVGSKPSPRWGNLAYIKSMEYQLKDGMRLKLEVVDQQGGVFYTYADSIIKCPEQMRGVNTISAGQRVDPKSTNEKYYMQVQWGWTLQRYADDPPEIVASPIVTFMNLGVQAEFRNGLVFFTVEAVDMMQVAFKMRTNSIYGTDTERMKLKDALCTMLLHGPPHMCCEFLTQEAAQGNKSASESKAKPPSWDWFQNGNNTGVASVWQTDTQSKAATANRWIEPMRANVNPPDGQGVVMRTDSTSRQPCVMFMPDPTSRCATTGDLTHDMFLGTYIVGGGVRGNVLGFTTHINWVGGFAMLMQGGSTGQGNIVLQNIAEITEKQSPCNKLMAAGVGRAAANNADNPNCIAAWGANPATRNEEVVKSMVLNKRANAIFANLLPLEAELRLQGNPNIRFVDMRLMGAAFASIIVLNPYYIWGDEKDTFWQIGVMEQQQNGTMQMIDRSACNNILSNKNWRVIGCTHSIKEGTYTTTLHVYLPTQLFGLDPTTPRVGGDATTGWSPSEFKNYTVACKPLPFGPEAWQVPTQPNTNYATE